MRGARRLQRRSPTSPAYGIPDDHRASIARGHPFQCDGQALASSRDFLRSLGQRRNATVNTNTPVAPTTRSRMRAYDASRRSHHGSGPGEVEVASTSSPTYVVVCHRTRRSDFGILVKTHWQTDKSSTAGDSGAKTCMAWCTVRYPLPATMALISLGDVAQPMVINTMCSVKSTGGGGFLSVAQWARHASSFRMTLSSGISKGGGYASTLSSGMSSIGLTRVHESTTGIGREQPQTAIITPEANRRSGRRTCRSLARRINERRQPPRGTSRRAARRRMGSGVVSDRTFLRPGSTNGKSPGRFGPNSAYRMVTAAWVGRPPARASSRQPPRRIEVAGVQPAVG